MIDKKREQRVVMNGYQIAAQTTSYEMVEAIGTISNLIMLLEENPNQECRFEVEQALYCGPEMYSLEELKSILRLLITLYNGPCLVCMKGIVEIEEVEEDL